MVNNNRIPRGYRNETHLPKRNSVYMGMVRGNFDAQRMGRLLVWISDFGPDDPDFWIPVSYATPFAGATPVDKTIPDGASMADSQQTYGWWATPPDRDNQVLCCFLDGDIANGYWFACIYPQNMNHMVPGIAGDTSTDASMDAKFIAGSPPVVEYNKYDTSQNPVTSNTLNSQREQVKRPVFTPLAEALIAQGLTKDVVRGVGNTSARRESPSRVHGFLSPRGHGWQIDDGARPEGGGEPENELIRFRTRNGVQILINDTEGLIYMISKMGKSWAEISDSGIDMWSAESISLASDKDVNIGAGGNLNMVGSQKVLISGGFVSTFSATDSNIVAGGNIYVDAVKDIGLKSSHDISLDGVRDVTLNAGRNILEGACGIVSRNGTILDNSGGEAPPEVPHAKFKRDPLTRIPTHEPFDRSGLGTGPTATGVDQFGNPVADVRRGDGTVVATPVSSNKAEIMKQLYESLKRRGWTEIAARQMVAQIGRENDYRDDIIFGYHVDPANRAVNVGMISWQGDRGKKLQSLLQSRGLIQGGKMARNTAALEAQLDFMEQEIQGKHEYRQTKDIIRNPSATAAQVEGVLSRNYVRWARDNPKYQATGLRRMGGYYTQLANIVGPSGNA